MSGPVFSETLDLAHFPEKATVNDLRVLFQEPHSYHDLELLLKREVGRESLNLVAIFKYGTLLMTKAVKGLSHDSGGHDITLQGFVENSERNLPAIKESRPEPPKEDADIAELDIGVNYDSSSREAVQSHESGEGLHDPTQKLPNGDTNDADIAGSSQTNSIARKSSTARRDSTASFDKESISSRQGLHSRKSSVTSRNGSVVALTSAVKADPVANTAHILRLWFECLSSDAPIASIFGLPGTDAPLTESHFTALLASLKEYIERVSANGLHYSFITPLKEVIILLHLTLCALFHAVLKDHAGTSNRFVIVKSLLHAFFAVDLSETINLFLVETHTKALPKTIALSYEVLMRLHVIYSTLAASPMEFVSVDKVGLSLDITSFPTTLPNPYANVLANLDFENEEIVLVFEARFLPLLLAMYSYFYSMEPDLLLQTTRSESFFGWITGNRFSLASYGGIDTLGELAGLFGPTPFLQEVEKFEYRARLSALVLITIDDPRATKAPMFLTLALTMYQLMKNHSFLVWLTTRPVTLEHQVVPFFDLWLCTASFVLQWQFKCRINTHAARLTLLILLKLTSSTQQTVHRLREYDVNEFKWKLCHQKGPVIPVDSDTDGHKLALLYIVDLMQVMFRYNLSKRVDMDNCKIALTVLYQVLLECEAHQFEGMHNYHWNELYKTLLNFVRFVGKNCNEEKVKYVVEEVFLIFDLVLGPTFSHILEKEQQYWLSGSHVARSINFDLLYLMLSHHDEVKALFDRFIIKRENFSHVESCLSKLAETFDLADQLERDMADITAKLNDMSVLSDGEGKTVVDRDTLNFAQTLLYCDRYNEHSEHSERIQPSELVEMIVNLYDNVWVYKRRKK